MNDDDDHAKAKLAILKTRSVSGSALMKRPSWAPVVAQDSRVILDRMSAHGAWFQR
ncbi:MAG: hypothetical protein JO266_11015 [Acidobacteria bacterium]|nr:hypothetical protein [Acidobacteriota bacterium]